MDQGPEIGAGAPVRVQGQRIRESLGNPDRLSRATPALPISTRDTSWRSNSAAPTSQHNIVPQWSNFQRNGKWKHMETAATARRKSRKSFKVRARRRPSIQRHRLIQAIPRIAWRASRGSACRAFKVATWVQDTLGDKSQKKTVFDAKQEQDKTDDMINVRLFEKADKTDEADDVDYSSMTRTPGRNKKGLETDDKMKLQATIQRTAEIWTDVAEDPYDDLTTERQRRNEGLQKSCAVCSHREGPATKGPAAPTPGPDRARVTIGPPPIVYSTRSPRRSKTWTSPRSRDRRRSRSCRTRPRRDHHSIPTWTVRPAERGRDGRSPRTAEHLGRDEGSDGE